VETLCFELGYRPKSAGGFQWGREDVLRMPFDEAIRMVDKVHETRQKEAAALKRAYGKGARGR
jgi:hypothetical protein